ncbi:PolC-type DNA polymerase III [Bacillaceae bacterium]
MGNLAEQKRRFELLLEQAELPREFTQAHMEEGVLEKLEVSRQNRLWTFHLRFPALIPGDVLHAFCQRIKEKFAHIARIDFHIRYEKPPALQELVDGHWPHALTFIAREHQTVAAYLRQLEPVVTENGIRLFLSDEVTCEAVKRRKIEDKFRAYFLKWCGMPVKVEFLVDDSQARYEEFLAQRKKEDETFVQEALQARETGAEKVENGDALPAAREELIIGYPINEEPVEIRTIREEERRITVQGMVFDAETRELRSGRTLLAFKLTDFTDSIACKLFSREKEDRERFSRIKKGIWLKVRGSVQYDPFERELVFQANDINEIKPPERVDTAQEKRVELHLHTPMSAMDACTPVSRLVEQAKKWGHPAIAITDHGVAQAFPEAHAAGKKYGIKIIYGMEANIVDDGVPIVHQPQHRELKSDTYIVFDVETTGLSAVRDKIIELAAVKVRGGEIVDTFESFVDPHQPLTKTISELTGITDEMLRGAPELDEVLRKFRDFVGDGVLAAHNARFDMGFLNIGYKRIGEPELANPVIDTLEMARFLYPGMKNYRLNTLCEKFNIELVSHHRAVYDARATGHLLWRMILDCAERNILYQDQLNENMGTGDIERQRPFHAILLVQNQTGLKNLYKLISLSHIQYFYRTPRIPRSELTKHREGLLVGSACDKGEVYEAVMQKAPEEAEEIAKFYDYLEIQPLTNTHHLIEKELVRDVEQLKEINRKIVQLGKKLNKPVVATGNVHYLEKHDKIYRQILVASLGKASPLDPDRLPDAYFRTTDEMLEEFKYLGEETAREVVIVNPNRIAEQIEDVQPVPDKLYTPVIEGADEEIRRMSYTRAKELYGDPLPELVEKRLEKELQSIIGHGFAVIYLISQKLVAKSLQDGYLVGSRGSVGSSFVATMTGITEVNPLPPHYRCACCKYSEFFTDGSIGSGFDLPDKDCPRCGAPLKKDGQDIPFETFLGFKGDKVPDIDLNFSGEYQPRAHKYTQELFGADNVFRAGTIGTVADKTAYGFVKKYEEEKGLTLRSAEVARLAAGCTGVKRTTGQHPGGIIVVPHYKEIYDFCPIQYPADDKTSEWRTTHFDFHSIHDNLLKLDILGHDDPTVIRMLQDLTGVDPKEIPIDDPKVLSIFRSTEALGVTPEEIRTPVGTLGIPEFGTKFVRQMLEDTKPTTFAELVQISGLSHGTDVWLNNAQELIRKGICELKDVIGCRDDIMVYLIYKGLEPSLAFKIMESVRKGKGLTPEMEEEMKKHGVPDWYIWSCKQIKYMFPKAHACAYVLMAVRIAYFKVYYPIEYYATYFTVRADDFDVALAVKGADAIRQRMEEIEAKGNDASPKEKNLLTVLELCYEMYKRGFHFKNVDLYRSDATRFIVDGNGLIPPFNAIQGVGTSAAQSIVKAREEGQFLSVEDFQLRTKVSKTVIELLEEHGCLKGLPESNQLSLF